MGRTRWILTCRVSDQPKFEELGFVETGDQVVQVVHDLADRLEVGGEDRPDLVTMENQESYEPSWPGPGVPFFGRHDDDRGGEYGPHQFACDGSGTVQYVETLYSEQTPAASLDLFTLQPKPDDMIVAASYQQMLDRTLQALKLGPLPQTTPPPPGFALRQVVQRLVRLIDTGALRQPEWEALDLESKRTSQQQTIYDEAVAALKGETVRPIDLVVFCEGGVVQDVIGSVPVEYDLLDWDNEQDGEPHVLSPAGLGLLDHDCREKVVAHNKRIAAIDEAEAAREKAEEAQRALDARIDAVADLMRLRPDVLAACEEVAANRRGMDPTPGVGFNPATGDQLRLHPNAELAQTIREEASDLAALGRSIIENARAAENHDEPDAQERRARREEEEGAAGYPSGSASPGDA